MVENMGDELWVGVKGQANPVIAGSPRNVFRYSVGCSASEVEHWKGKGAYKLTDLSQTPNAVGPEPGSEGAGAKLRVREGNNPDRQLRPQNLC